VDSTQFQRMEVQDRSVKKFHFWWDLLACRLLHSYCVQREREREREKKKKEEEEEGEEEEEEEKREAREGVGWEVKRRK
jgi:hypothetical protein